MSTTIFWSRFPDEEVTLPQEPDMELYSLHVLDMGIVMMCRWVHGPSGWEQLSPTFFDGGLVDQSLALAREMIPEGFEREECPASFGAEIWVRRRR